MKKVTWPFLVAVASAGVAPLAWSADRNVVTDPVETRVVCKKQQVIGTRIPQRVCKMQRQIDTDKQNAREATDTWQRDGNMQKAKG